MFLLRLQLVHCVLNRMGQPNSKSVELLASYGADPFAMSLGWSLELEVPVVESTGDSPCFLAEAVRRWRSCVSYYGTGAQTAHTASCALATYSFLVRRVTVTVFFFRCALAKRVSSVCFVCLLAFR